MYTLSFIITLFFIQVVYLLWTEASSYLALRLNAVIYCLDIDSNLYIY